jgi:hypothetical protein
MWLAYCYLQNIFNEGDGQSFRQQYEQFTPRPKWLFELKLPNQPSTNRIYIV